MIGIGAVFLLFIAAAIRKVRIYHGSFITSASGDFMADKRNTAEMIRAIQGQGVENWVVLVVDDDADNLELASSILSWQQATVYTALGGQAGLKLLETVHPTVILLDLSMPRLDGWAMIEEIRRRPHLVQTPVIALTAHAMDDDRSRVESAGFDGFIAKPFHISGFIGAIHDCLSRTMGAGV
jgi:two-component system cell cycle response regulator DivK